MLASRVLLFTLVLFASAPLLAQEPTTSSPIVDPDFDPELSRVETLRANRVRELKRRIQRSLVLKRWPVAIQEMNELAVLEPYNAEFQLTWGLLFRKTNNIQESRRRFQDFMDLGGHPAVAHLLMAETYAAQNQKDEVFDHLRQAAEHGMNVLKAVKQFETLAPYRDDTEFIKLALKLEKYDLELTARSDPTTDRFRKQSIFEEEDDTPRGVDRLSRDDQESRLRRAKHYLSNIERYLSLQNEEKAMESYRKLIEVTEDVDKFTIPALAAAMRAIINKKQIIEARIEEIRLKYHFEEAKTLIARMQREFQNEDYPEVVRLNAQLEKISRRMTNVNTDFNTVASKVLEIGRNWVRKANIRRDFNTKTLTIQGIITHTGPPFAIVNSRLISVGDELENMRVLRIEPNQIFFDYQGEQIPLLFRLY